MMRHDVNIHCCLQLDMLLLTGCIGCLSDRKRQQVLFVACVQMAFKHGNCLRIGDVQLDLAHACECLAGLGHASIAAAVDTAHPVANAEVAVSAEGPSKTSSH